MPPQSTPSSVTKNRIKSDYHKALEGFADWYFNIFPNGDNVADNDERKTLLTPSDAPLRYFEMADKAKFVKHMEDVDIDKNILFVHVIWKRETHFWPEGHFGQTYFNHLRSGLLLRLNEISSGPMEYSPQATSNIKKFYQGLNNELKDKKDDAGWDSKDTSAVPWSVYLAIATYLLNYDVTYWLMFLLQWNLMSRSIDITKINITSFSFDNDMLTILYTHRKTQRKKSTSKPKTVHIASNPINPIVCCVLALAVNILNKNIDNLQLFEGGSIKSGYGKAINAALDDPAVKEALKAVGLSKAKIATHSLRKSAATYAASGTDGTPMHFTILLRGGWSIGNVLERYFSQADHGDKLIANILAGRNFFTSSFSQLIPHFKPDKNIKRYVLKSLFQGKYIDDNFDEMEGFLQMMVAQLVYHYDFLEITLGENSSVVGALNRNFLNHQDLKNALGPDFADESTQIKATGQGGSVVYQRLEKIEKQNDKILQTLDTVVNLLTGTHNGNQVVTQRVPTAWAGNTNENELVSCLKKLVLDGQKATVAAVKKTIQDISGVSAPTDVQQVHLNVFVHNSVKGIVWKVAKTYRLPTDFREMVRQYVFSNRSTRQTALRDCNARNIFYDVTDDPNNAKKKKAFRKKYQRAIVAVNCFLQFAYIKHREKYNCFLNERSDPYKRGTLFNQLYRSAWVDFNSTLVSRKRKRKLNEFTPGTVYMHMHRRTDDNSTFIKRLRTSCNLSTTSKREQEWSYPLPSLTFTESDASPLLDIEENSTASATTSNMMMSMPLTSAIVDSSSTTSSTTTTTTTNIQQQL